MNRKGEQATKFREVLALIWRASPRAWVYLPRDKDWNLETEAAILESDEVSPEVADQPDAGIPEFAKQRGLIQVIPVTSLQDVVSNARAQKPLATLDDLFHAFWFYHERDAFIEFER